MKFILLAIGAALALAACSTAAASSSAAPPQWALTATCGVTVVDGQTGIGVVMSTVWDTPVYVRQVKADWYGTVVTVNADRSIPVGGQVEVDQPLPPSLY